MTSVQQQKSEKKEKAKNLKWLRDKDREMVKGKFIFHELPGGMMSFAYRAYKEDPVEIFHLLDGEIYTLPLGVARHLNKNCWYPEYDFIPGEPGIRTGYGPNMPGAHYAGKVMKIAKKVRRCSFQSLEFIDIDDLTPDIGSDVVTVEHIVP